MLFCGDLVFNGGTPFLLMGSVAGAVEVLEEVVRPLGARTIVPGHGPVFSGPGPVDATLDYLRFVLDLAEGARAAGLAPLEAARQADLGRFADWPDAERVVGNLHRAMAELGGTPRGGPIDIVTALADMVDLQRRRPAALPGLILRGRTLSPPPAKSLVRDVTISIRPPPRAHAKCSCLSLPGTSIQGHHGGAAMTQTASHGINGLREMTDGAVIVPGEPDFDDARRVWNAEIDKRPRYRPLCHGARCLRRDRLRPRERA